MKFAIHYKDDSFVIEAETIEELQLQAYKETERRGWDADDCWSEEIRS